MIGGDFPWRYMTKPELRVLAINGFTVHEVAVVTGTSDDAARWMLAEALRLPAKPTLSLPCTPSAQ